MVLWVGEAPTLGTADDWASLRMPARRGALHGSSVGTTSSTVTVERLGRLLSSRGVSLRETAREPESDVLVIGADPISPYTTDAIVWEGRTFVLTHRITCTVKWNEGLWTIDCEPINASAYSRTHGEAIEAFQEEFAMLYDHYAVAEDAALAPDAIPLKGSLRRLVKEVREG